MLSLVDSGFAINTGFPPVVGSQRHADVIISLNYSWDQDQFMVREALKITEGLVLGGDVLSTLLYMYIIYVFVTLPNRF